MSHSFVYTIWLLTQRGRKKITFGLILDPYSMACTVLWSSCCSVSHGLWATGLVACCAFTLVGRKGELIQGQTGLLELEGWGYALTWIWKVASTQCNKFCKAAKPGACLFRGQRSVFVFLYKNDIPHFHLQPFFLGWEKRKKEQNESASEEPSRRQMNVFFPVARMRIKRPWFWSTCGKAFLSLSDGQM